MSEQFKIVIVGAGPAGLAAAAHAAELGLNHILLEAEPEIANTIRHFHHGKEVMDEPREPQTDLNHNSLISFKKGTREQVLANWEAEIQANPEIKLRKNSKVIGIVKRPDGLFNVELNNQSIIEAEYIVLAIGTQGNVRKLNVAGAECSKVQYELANAKDISNETIIVVGAGDAGVEDAYALLDSNTGNTVNIVNREDNFAQCNGQNSKKIQRAIKQGLIEHFQNAEISKIELSSGALPLEVTVSQKGKTDVVVPCHRVLVRIGASPPVALMKGFGITFTPRSEPELNMRYESSTPNLFVIGNLTGQALIKHALAQGVAVIQSINDGKAQKTKEESLLHTKIMAFDSTLELDEYLKRLNEFELFKGLSLLQVSKILLNEETSFARFKKDEIIPQGKFILSLENGTRIKTDGVELSLNVGDFYGETGLISGRTNHEIKAETGTLLIIPQDALQKLLNVKGPIESRCSQWEMLKSTAFDRFLDRHLGKFIPPQDLQKLKDSGQYLLFKSGEEIYKQGNKPEGAYLLTKGSVTVSRVIGEREVILSYLSAGSTFGEMELISGHPSYTTVRVNIDSEVMLLSAVKLQPILSQPEVRLMLNERYVEYLKDNDIHHFDGSKELNAVVQPSSLISFLVEHGVGEASDLLLIDETLCIGCNNCEIACAKTHHGVSRLNREVGPLFAHVRVATACRHCENPMCMSACAYDAIRRDTHGEVLIKDNCIGCGHCESKCPYGVIQMASIDVNHTRPSLWRRMFKQDESNKTGHKAVKCDLCQGQELAGKTACEHACPTGAANRISPENILNRIGRDTKKAVFYS